MSTQQAAGGPPDLFQADFTSSLPHFPVILYPRALEEVLNSRPKRETFKETAPMQPHWEPPLGLKILTQAMKLIGMRKQAGERLKEAQKPLIEQYERDLSGYTERKRRFEAKEDLKFTPAALRDYRKKRIGHLLESSIPEVGREGYAQLGHAEDFFLEHLQTHFGPRIGRHFQVGSPHHTKGYEYVPDFAYYDPRHRLRICIEVDEPYSGQKAIHYVEHSEVENSWTSVDHLRDRHFLALGWLVVRFSEEQVCLDPQGCCRVIAEVIERVTGETSPTLKDQSPVPSHPRWDRLTANGWADEGYRHTYLGNIKRSQQVKAEKKHKADPEPSEHQKAIYHFVEHGEGHGLVLAVAGSGKSTTLLKVAELALKKDPGARILLMAFTKDIQLELEAKRKERELDIDVMTLNGFGFGILKRRNRKTKSKSSATRYGGYTMNLLKAQGSMDPEGDTETVLEIIKFCKSYQVEHHNFEEVLKVVENYGITREVLQKFHTVVTRVMDCVKDRHTRTGEIDFDDQCWLPVKENWTLDPYDLILVDECQDLTQTQLTMAQQALKEGGRLLFVGDERQAIMGFRGADNNSVNNIRQLSPTELPLSVCYRCPKSHIERAQKIMPTIQWAPNAIEGTVQQIPFRHLPSFAGPGDLMFARTRATLRLALYQLIKAGRTIKFAEKQKMDDDKDDDKGTNMRLDKAIENLQGLAKLGVSLATERGETFLQAVDLLTARQKNDNLGKENKLALSALRGLYQSRDFQEPQDFLPYLASHLTPSERGVTLCTAHQAKGLEANRVFVLSMEDFNVRDPKKLEWENQQERNLWYVALTRAKRELYLVSKPEF